MTWMEHSAEWRRRATALVSALVLVLHIVAMAVGAIGLPASDGAAQVHGHHTAAAEHDAGSPTEDLGHKPPCCILSVCPGLPGLPDDHALTCLPAPEARMLIFQVGLEFAAQPSPLLPPVGARAPPVRT